MAYAGDVAVSRLKYVAFFITWAKVVQYRRGTIVHETLFSVVVAHPNR